MIENWLKERHKKQKNNTEKRCANQREALASLNAKVSNRQFEINKLKAENDRLREALEKVKNVCTEQDTNIDSLVLAYSICRRVLNGESEDK